MSLHCPACKKPVKAKGMPGHSSRCPMWEEKIGVPPSQFNFDEYFQRGLYAPSLKEGVDYLSCKICGYRKKRIADHVRKVHGLSADEYRKKYNALTSIPSTLKKRKATVRARYGVDNVFQSEEVKEKLKATVMDKYGVESVAHSDEVIAKRKRTNISRYGVENPFASEEIQEKIKETNTSRYGVPNPNQAPEIIQKRLRTNFERYGSPVAPQNEEMNGFEREVAAIDSRLQFTGGGDVWFHLPSLKKLRGKVGGYKNPDFIVRDESGDITKVVECFGKHWHGPKIRKMSRHSHQWNTIVAYAEVGIKCLVIWEDDFNRDRESAEELVRDFLG